MPLTDPKVKRYLNNILNTPAGQEFMEYLEWLVQKNFTASLTQDDVLCRQNQGRALAYRELLEDFKNSNK
jgi:hypothetical protein